MTGSSTGSGKCQSVRKPPFPPLATPR
jgi:hypothetical protein